MVVGLLLSISHKVSAQHFGDHLAGKFVAVVLDLLLGQVAMLLEQGRQFVRADGDQFLAQRLQRPIVVLALRPAGS